MTAEDSELEKSRWAEWQASVPEGGIVVTEAKESLYSNVMLDGRHLLFADEPEAHGSEDLGPTPKELALMALGACTSMTLRMYAGRKQWPVEDIIVRLRYTTPDNAPREAKRKIARTVEIIGPLSAEQRERLLEIANKCPVHELLTRGAEIDTQLG